MRPKVALKLLLIACGASVVAYILTSATRSHPHVTCTGPHCDETVQKPRDSKSDNHQKEGNHPSNFQVASDIKTKVDGNDGTGHNSKNVKVKDEGNGNNDGNNWINVEIGAFEKTGSEDDIDNRFEELDQILNENAPSDKEQQADVEKAFVERAVDIGNENAYSYLEKTGVIQNNKAPKIMNDQKILYSWKLQGILEKDKSSVNESQKNNGQGQHHVVRSESDKRNADDKNADVPEPNIISDIGNTFSNKENGENSGDSARVHIPPNRALGANNGENVDMNEHSDVNFLNHVEKNSTYKNLDVETNVADAADQSAVGKAINVQGILRAASLSARGEIANISDNRRSENARESNDMANQSTKAQPGNSSGNLLLTAGVIEGGKSQKILKADAVEGLGSLGGNLQKIEVDHQQSQTRQEKRKLCVEFLTGTGNILFQFATAYAIAKDRNMTLIIPEHIPKFSEAFDLVGGVDDTISFDQSRCEGIIEATNFKRGLFDETFLKRLPSDADIKLKGYFQSFKYFERYEEDIRDILTFKDDVTSKAMEAVNVLHFKKFGMSLHHAQTSQAITLVGVHVRRHPVTGRQSIKQEDGYRVADHDYVQRAMTEMRNRHTGHENSAIRFYIVSDDEAWANARLGIKDLSDTLLVTGLSWAPSLALLANMDHVITTVGTLGWWGAWLADGDVIYYQNFLEPGSKMDSAYLVSDFFPSIWTPMV